MKAKRTIAVLVMTATTALFAQDVKVRQYAGEAGGISARAIKQTHLDVPSDGFSVFGISLFPGCAWPRQTAAVCGLRLDLLMGRNHDVYGLDVGLLANETDYVEDGIAVGGLFNNVGRSDGVFMVAGAYNYVKYDTAGVQVAVGYNSADVECSGLQLAAFNSTARLTGIQLGVFNKANRGSGLQLGVINYAESLTGLQLGVWNVNVQATLSAFPIVNGAF